MQPHYCFKPRCVSLCSPACSSIYVPTFAPLREYSIKSPSMAHSNVLMNNTTSPVAPESPVTDEQLNAQTAFAIIASNVGNTKIKWDLLHQAFLLVPGTNIPQELESKLKKLRHS